MSERNNQSRLLTVGEAANVAVLQFQPSFLRI